MAAKKQSEVLVCVRPGEIGNVGLSDKMVAWADANKFDGQAGRLLPLPDNSGGRCGHLFGMGASSQHGVLQLGLAGAALDAGNYHLAGDFGDPTLAMLGFELGAYQFSRYGKEGAEKNLTSPDDADKELARRLVKSATIARDLINIPANDLGPDAFEAEIRAFAKDHKIKVSAIVGDELIKQGFPMIHAVGRASVEAPRLIELNWGKKTDPKITLVGKGVTFDTGGLDIKPPAGMVIMKKDMGGAANVLGLTHAIVDAKLKVNLRVLLPVVENAIAGNAFRPGDILPSRAGMHVEIGNTDAEGRLILADALTLADEQEPELIIDMATLTGAARVALGAELPPLYTSNDALADALMQAGLAWDDPLWRLPLWAGYDRLLASKIADVNHISTGGFAGSITAALFLQRFVTKAKDWVHLDIYGWAPEARAGRSQGGTDQAIRAVYTVLAKKYG